MSGASARAVTPMLPVLAFERTGLARVIVKLGEEQVAEILPMPSGARAWRVILHGESGAFRHAGNMMEARCAIVDAVNDWLVRIGIFYPGAAVAIVDRFCDAARTPA